MWELAGPVLGWYVAIQLCGLALWPVARYTLWSLPDRGYGVAKILGILAVGYVLWIGNAFGLVRNETGGVWFALIFTGLLSWLYGWKVAHDGGASEDLVPQPAVGQGANNGLSSIHVILTEAIFLLAFLGWAVVRAYDPAANHTEQPMDLMFLNSIWHSPVFPPQDAWLGGYAISYYYFGYWLLAMLGRLAQTPPEIAYNVGQAAWFGLLCSTCYSVAYNLLAFGRRGGRSSQAGGIFAVAGIVLAGNLQGVMEWLYANGFPVGGVARWIGVHNFPEGAAVTGKWYISDSGWWWWRSSRVIHDRNLQGGHVEVIDEFPKFSYVLGDNHPHVLAMPVVLLVIAIAMSLLFAAYMRERRRPQSIHADPDREPQPGTGDAGNGGRLRDWWNLAQFGVQRRVWLLGMWAVGSLLFLNTWDYPPYWGLLVLCAGAGLWRSPQRRNRSGLRLLGGLVLLAGGLAAGGLALYFPYLLTAQSQAGGIVPNFFNPTRIQQFLVMFGGWAPGILLLLWLGIRQRQGWGALILRIASFVLGIPIVFLLLSAWLALTTESGQALLARMPLDAESQGYGMVMAQRWSGQGYTFLIIGICLTVTVALMWRWFGPGADVHASDPGREQVLRTATGPEADGARHARMGFALLLLFCGLVLVYLPEFVFLRDQFGTRMNTIFKFYYQAWLLFGLAGAYAVVEQLRGWRATGVGPNVAALLSVLLVASSLIFGPAAVYSKTGGFGAPRLTFDSTQYIQAFAPDVDMAMRWIRTHVPSNALVLEAEGRSYSAEHNRVSTMTGRPTLLGWPGHQRQWRGDAYGEMAAGRTQAIEAIYRSRDPQELRRLVESWAIDYIYVSPVERRDYQMSDINERMIAMVGELVFAHGDVNIYRFHEGGAD